MIDLALPTDTSPDAEEAQLECFRRLTPQDRLRKMLASSCRGRDLALAAIRRVDPALPEAEVRLRYLGIAYGEALAAEVRRWLGAGGT
jgi:hypothetical protein